MNEEIRLEQHTKKAVQVFKNALLKTHEARNIYLQDKMEAESSSSLQKTHQSGVNEIIELATAIIIKRAQTFGIHHPSTHIEPTSIAQQTTQSKQPH